MGFGAAWKKSTYALTRHQYEVLLIAYHPSLGVIDTALSDRKPQ